MIGRIKEYEIIIAKIPFQEREQGKWRPAFVLKFEDEVVKVLKITTKFQNKSDYIKQFYFEIRDWLEAGLHEPSWIDTVRAIPIEIEGLKVRFVGYLSKEDEQRLLHFIEGREF